MWVNKSRRMGWEGHLAVWDKRELHRGFWWAHKEDRVCKEGHLAVCGRRELYRGFLVGTQGGQRLHGRAFGCLGEERTA
jgi:hypothetical protein